jgi:hypothetical protein
MFFELQQVRWNLLSKHHAHFRARVREGPYRGFFNFLPFLSLIDTSVTITDRRAAPVLSAVEGLAMSGSS